MYIVIMRHNFTQENKVFNSYAAMTKWAYMNGYTLRQNKKVSHIYHAEF